MKDRQMTKYSCGHDTNHKSGVCIACNFNKKFGREIVSPASRPSKVTEKQTQGVRGSSAGDTTPTYTNKKLKHYARGQISYLLALAYQGNIPNLIKRLHFLQRSLRSGR